jgi:hypothetical protein
VSIEHLKRIAVSICVSPGKVIRQLDRTVDHDDQISVNLQIQPFRASIPFAAPDI